MTIPAVVYEQLYYMSQFTYIISYVDHDLWPFAAKIYSVHKHAIVDTSIKFGENPFRDFGDIAFTRSCDEQRNRETEKRKNGQPENIMPPPPCGRRHNKVMLAVALLPLS